MNKKLFTLFGWIILLSVSIIWLTTGYSSLNLFTVPVAMLLFSLGDGSYKKWQSLKNVSVSKVFIIGGAFLLAIAIIYFLLQFAGYLIADVLHLTGPTKMIMQFLAVVLCLYPIKFLFASVVVKVVK